MVHMIDARVEGKHLWTLNAHSEGINGMSLSSQCPDCLVTGSSDQTVKVWDIKDNKPSCVLEKDIRIGLIHSLEACPDAPFVFSMGGDTPSNNLHVWDIREAAVGKISHF
jgi:periodic tryptophan protein 1